MAHENSKKVERLIELYPNQALYKMHLDALREQDKNARILSGYKFDRLTENIAKNDKLRSMPLAVKRTNPSGNEEFEIISGHHRVRAARAAGIMEVFVMVEEEDMSRDEVIAEQLAQNSLQGYDDPQVLAELYKEIADLDARIASGLLDHEIEFDVDSPKIDEIALELDFELVNILFLRSHYERFKEVLELIEQDAHLYLADKQDWNRFADIVRTAAHRDDVRNIAAIFTRFMDIVEEYYANSEEEEKESGGDQQSESASIDAGSSNGKTRVVGT